MKNRWERVLPVHNRSTVHHGFLSRTIKVSLALVLLLGMHHSVFAQNGAPIGVVLITTGDVQARSTSGAIRTLARYAPIYQDDTILVGANSMMQIRMVDDAQFSFKANTEFTFNQYQYDGESTTADSAIMSMLRGGFRTISGSIGDSDEDSYRVDTPMASIGVRGTTHTALIIDGTLFTGVSAGGTTISNNAGSLDIGIGGDFDFSETLLGNAPEGLLIEPVQLNQLQFVAVENEAAATAGGASVANTAAPAVALAAPPAGNSVAAANPPPTTPPLQTDNPDNDINPLVNSREAEELIIDSGGTPPAPGNGNDPDDDNEAGSDNGSGDDGGNDPGNGPGGDDGNDPGDDNEPGDNDNGSDPDDGNGPGDNDDGNDPDNGNGSGDNDDGNDPDNGNGPGDNDDGDDPDNGNGPGDNDDGDDPDSGNGPGDNDDGDDPDSGNGPGDNDDGNDPDNGNGNNSGNDPTPPRTPTLLELLARLTGLSIRELSELLALTADVPAQTLSSLGEWERSSVTPQATENGAGFRVADPLRAVLQPANMADLSGVANYQGSIVQGHDDAGGELLGANLQFTVDFLGGPNAISNGSLHVIDSDTQAWNVTFDGSLQGADVLMHNISGTFDASPEPVTGNIDGFFTGAGSAPSFAGGFSLEAGSDMVQGLMVVDPVNGP